MRKLMLAAVAALGTLLLPGPAKASEGFATTDVNLRAGPGTVYPVITVVRRGSPVYVHGCLSGYSWCDISLYNLRGWVSSRYLNVFYDDRQVYMPYRPRVSVPIITFDFGYWDRWYPHYGWYREWRYRDDWGWRNDPPPRRDWGGGLRNDDVIIRPRGDDSWRNDRRERLRDRELRLRDRETRQREREIRQRERIEQRQSERRLMQERRQEQRNSGGGSLDCVIGDPRCPMPPRSGSRND